MRPPWLRDGAGALPPRSLPARAAPRPGLAAVRGLRGQAALGAEGGQSADGPRVAVCPAVGGGASSL